ncbi:MAG TPA: PEGA domain-containing protein [Candidatus Sulfotelmatobacter sp.]
MSALLPDFVVHWWKKNAKNYPGVCLSSKPNPGARNYLLVFSESERYYSGLMPTTHTYTSSSSTTLTANGSAFDQAGNTWTYTATGDAQTTTTTTVQENVPYTDRFRGLFVKTYDSSGRIIRSDGHVYRSRTGGDSSSTAGYNIGSALTNINARGRMLKSALSAVAGDQDAPLPVGTAGAKVQSMSAIQSAPAGADAESTTPLTKMENGGHGAAPGVAARSASEATAEISSEPAGAEVEIDGSFVGSTPSTLSITPGEHNVLIWKRGYEPWERTLRASTGNIKIAAVLESKPAR